MAIFAMHKHIRMEKTTELLRIVNDRIASIEYPKGSASPAGLYTPIEYTLREGGKRLRPLLTLAAAAALGKDPETVADQAAAIEMFHNFTLIHDDVMDRSPRRRGKPTVYRRWDERRAILSGDALLTMATQMMMRGAGDRTADVLDIFNRTAMLVYEGQQYDIEFENRSTVSEKAYLHMILLKTSVLLGGACEIGAAMAGASDEVREAFYQFGVKLGLAFQLRDDWLDIYGDRDVFGKAIGNDINTGKRTWFYVMAAHESHDRMAEAFAIEPGKRRVAVVRALYDRLHLSERCDRLIDRYIDEALDALGSVPIDSETRRWFEDLAHSQSRRVR